MRMMFAKKIAAAFLAPLTVITIAVAPTAGAIPHITASPGTPIYVVPSWQTLLPMQMDITCTLGTVTKKGYGVTAGHCGSVNDRVMVKRNRHYYQIGRIVYRTVKRGDFAIISFNVPTRIGHNSFTPSSVGHKVWKQGQTTGVTHGTVTTPIKTFSKLMYPVLPGGFLGVKHSTMTQGQVTTLCSRQGDSGGPVIDTATGNITGIVVGTQNTDDPGPSSPCRKQEFSLIAPLSNLPVQYR